MYQRLADSNDAIIASGRLLDSIRQVGLGLSGWEVGFRVAAVPDGSVQPGLRQTATMPSSPTAACSTASARWAAGQACLPPLTPFTH